MLITFSSTSYCVYQTKLCNRKLFKWVTRFDSLKVYVMAETNPKVHKKYAYLNNHMHVEFFGIEANAFIESSPLAIIKVHSYIHLP